MERTRRKLSGGRTPLLLIFVLVNVTLSAQFAGGRGTQEDPWQIARPGDLALISEYLGAENNERYFIQTHDIELGEAPWNQDEGWVPIGSSVDNSFRGKYNGNGFEIRGLTIQRQTGWNGLFGLTVDATLENIKLVNVNITAIANVGGLAGYTERTLAKRCSISEGSSITGATTGTNRYVAGLIGYALNSHITECSSGARITGRERSGGLIGWLNASHVSNSYATGQVNSSHVVGGLVGLLQTWGTGQGASSVRNSYARGNVGVANGQQTGGLIGTVSGAATLENNYSTGFITGAGGGLIGQGGAATNSYWDTETSGRDTSAGGAGVMGRLTRQMIYPYDLNEAFVRWDFEEIWRGDEDFVIDENPGINHGYPYLFFQQRDDPEPLDTPVVKIDVIEQEGVNVVRLRWEAIEGAVSYKIYASDYPVDGEWGEPVAVTDRVEYTEEMHQYKFFYVVASTDDLP